MSVNRSLSYYGGEEEHGWHTGPEEDQSISSEMEDTSSGWHIIPEEDQSMSFEMEDTFSDEECGFPNLYRKKNITISSDINKKLFKKDTWKFKKTVTKKPAIKLASVHANVGNFVDMIDTVDRPGDAYAEDIYARAGTYANTFEREPGKRIPKAGAYAEAGVGRARAEYSVFEAEAKGPNASAGVQASVVEVGAMARVEIGSASAKAGPFGVKVGLGFDTGASAGVNGVEAKFLGIGFSFGPKTSVSFLGSEVSCAIM